MSGMVVLDRELLVRRRNRHAADAAQHVFLLERVADDLAERLSAVRRAFPVTVDLGAHDGTLSRRLRGLPGIDTIVSAERSVALLDGCPRPRVQADEELLPFRDASLDLIVSALALQFVNDLPGVLAQARRALKPDGLFLASLLGGRTLSELRAAFITAEDELEGGAGPRVAPFADVRDLGALLQRTGFALPVVDSETVSVTYRTPLDLMRDIKAMGASNVLAARPRTPMKRRTLLRAAEVYQERFAAPGGRVAATFEILTMTGWAPHASQQQPLAPGSATARLADALGADERPLPRAATD